MLREPTQRIEVALVQDFGTGPSVATPLQCEVATQADGTARPVVFHLGPPTMRLTTTASILCLTFAIHAQSKVISSPPQFLTIEAGTGGAPLASSFFGGYADYETQIFDGYHRGGGVKLISQIEHRIDYRNYKTAIAARTWATVALHMSDGTWDGPMYPVFSANTQSTPTMVFSGSANWPALSGFPNGMTKPNPWGAQVKFPFATVWATTGAKDILQHFKFSGGTLANNAAWTGRNNYLLDADRYTAAGRGYYYVYGGPWNCIDSYQSAFGYAYTYAVAYAKNAFNATYNDKLTIDTRSYRTGPSALVLQAYALKSANLTLPGIACQKLSVDVTQSIIFTAVANFGGYSARRFTAPWNPLFKGMRLYMQAAWSDSVTKETKLSRPAFTIILDQPTGKFRALYKIGTTAIKLSTSPAVLPVVRYTYN
jgi:hypothetical protein